MRLVLYVIAAACAVFLYTRGVIPDTPGKHRIGTLTLNDISLSGDEAAPFEIARMHDREGWSVIEERFSIPKRSHDLDINGKFAGYITYAIHENRDVALYAAQVHYRRVAAIFYSGGPGGGEKVIGDACWHSEWCNNCALIIVRRNCCIHISIHGNRLRETDHEKGGYNARRLAVSLARKIVAKIDSSWLW